MNRSIAFVPTEEQSLFQDSLRRFLQVHSPTSRVRQVMMAPPGFDEALWQRMAQELALPGLGIAEAQGGSGFGWVEVCMAAEELGRALVPSPYLATSVLSVAMLQTVAAEDPLLERLASGAVRSALAILEGSAGWMHSGFACQARAGCIHGVKQFVIDGAQAEVLLVVAGEAGGAGLYAVERGPGMDIQPLDVIDPTRRLAHIRLTAVPARRIGGVTPAQLDRVLDLGATALAAEMVGGLSRLFDDTLAYTRLRVQFGRTIASFQAIKHRMAELLLQVELARSAAWYAAQAVDAGAADLSYLASLAKSTVSDAYLRVAQESIQLHGGIGFTWDHDTQLWFKRAKASEVLLGTPSWHRDRMISCLETGAAKVDGRSA